MNPTEKESILTLALMAGFADGVKNDAERAELKRIAQSLPQDVVQPAALYQRVLLKQVTLMQAAASLHTPELRQLAYEMAVCVCDADGAQTDAEKAFLANLHRELQLDPAATAPFERSADALAAEPLAAGAVVAASAPRPAADAELDRMILNYAILNGALELMPESLATMAIIPLQMKMVYRIGKHHGHELDRGHIKELAATAGLGLTSQVVEGYARKLLGGLLGKVGGGMGKSVGKQVASSAMSFASTWALGKMAGQYYSGGRKLSAIEMRQLFTSLTGQARDLHANYASAIRDKAGSLNLTQLLPIIRGQP
ncbi:MAG: DUF533 domain-containing protein [Verrucomicrobia subdivision 3 bacterium]|nr:DUF533 domain-containing protein [Limisphaerales bacterium]